jgi:hypothetical protein
MNSYSERPSMKLKDAVEVYRREPRASQNVYDWYRRFAKRRGNVLFGRTTVSAFKRHGIWHVDGSEFQEALRLNREQLAEIGRITEDHRKGIIHGCDGDRIETEWGGYQIRGPFRFEWNNYEVIRKKSSGRWICNACNSPANTEHKKDECHLCRDWNGCGQDCTLSRVFCVMCSTSLEV